VTARVVSTLSVLFLSSLGFAQDPWDNPDSLERSAARTLLIGTRGAKHVPGDEFETLICDLKVGGIILFDRDVAKKGAPRNIRSPEQVRALTKQLHELARFCGDPPLLIAVDEEGGAVNRLSSFPELRKVKSHAELGKGDPRATFSEAEKIARAMHAAGLNWTLAPVVDVNINPQNPVIGRHGRSFSADPDVVTRHAHAFIRGLNSFGILNCIKHYPGHGSSKDDSHLNAVDISDTSQPYKELFPFRVLIDRGIVDCVMTAHIYDKKVDPKWIVTFSSKALTGDLRGELGFKGVVVSDDLQMKAVTKRYSLAQAAVMTLSAGSDMVTISNNRSRYEENLARSVHDAIMDAVRDGRLSEERIREASGRVRAMKEKLIVDLGKAQDKK